MAIKNILISLIILGFLAAGTIFVINDGAAYALQSPDTRMVYLPYIMNFTPPPIPTRTSTPVSPGCTLTHNYAFEERLYVLINEERAKVVGLKPLVVNYPLETSSGIHSDDMAVNHFMDHTGSDGSKFWDRAKKAGYTGSWGGEIIMGGSTPEYAVKWWMGDEPHKAMILGDLDDFGAGYSHCSSNNNSGNYFTVDFGHR